MRKLRKENGRLAPSKKREIAKLRNKIFECNSCDASLVLPEPEFGAENTCPKCGSLMSEKIDL